MNAKILHILPVIAFIIFFIILAGVFIAFILLPNYIENLDLSLYITASPKNNNWQGAFLYHGILMGATVTFLALPQGQKPGTEIIIGPVRFEDWHPLIYDVYWSADGTVAAVRTDCAHIKEDYLGFTYAYDFLENKKYAPADKWYKQQTYDFNDITIQIEKLLEKRGGKGKNIYMDDMRFRKLKGKEKRQWKPVTRKIRQAELTQTQ